MGVGHGRWPTVRPFLPPPAVSGNGTAVSDPAQPAANGNGRANAQPVVAPVGWMYGDGTAVDQSNLAEVETFQSYLAAKQAAPDSKEALLAHYRQALG
jgi:hypothetical protein